MLEFFIMSLHIFLANNLHFPCSLHSLFDLNKQQQQSLINCSDYYHHYNSNLHWCKDQLKRKGERLLYWQDSSIASKALS